MGWLTVYKKEVLEFMRDKRVLFSAVLGPLIVEVIIIFIFGYVFNTVQTEKNYTVFVNDREAAAPILEPLEKTGRFIIGDVEDRSQIDSLLKAQVADVVLEFPEDFERASAAGDMPEVTIVSDTNEQSSQIAAQVVGSTLEKYLASERQRRLSASDLDPEAYEAFSIGQRSADTGKAFGGSMLASFLPYLIILWAFYGGFAIVSDLVAGEKERGTLETLLVSPISRTHIAIGKFLALATVSFAATVSALMGVVVTGLMNVDATRVIFDGALDLSLESMFAMFLALVPLIVFFSAMLLSLSTIARNQREVQGYLSLVSFLVLVPAMMSQFIGLTDAATSKWIAFTPILNTATVLRQALLEKVDYTTLAITTGISVLMAVVALATVVRLFGRESVLFRT